MALLTASISFAASTEFRTTIVCPNTVMEDISPARKLELGGRGRQEFTIFFTPVCESQPCLTVVRRHVEHITCLMFNLSPSITEI